MVGGETTYRVLTLVERGGVEALTRVHAKDQPQNQALIIGDQERNEHAKIREH